MPSSRSSSHSNSLMLPSLTPAWARAICFAFASPMYPLSALAVGLGVDEGVGVDAGAVAASGAAVGAGETLPRLSDSNFIISPVLAFMSYSYSLPAQSNSSSYIIAPCS